MRTRLKELVLLLLFVALSAPSTAAERVIEKVRIAVTIGAADDFVARHLIHWGDFDPRDVNFINMGGSDTRFAALHAGQIDATVVEEVLRERK